MSGEREVVGPPDVWGALTEDSTEAEIEAVDAQYGRWLASEDGKRFLAQDAEVVDYANKHAITYREAMDALGYRRCP